MKKTETRNILKIIILSLKVIILKEDIRLIELKSLIATKVIMLKEVIM